MEKTEQRDTEKAEGNIKRKEKIAGPAKEDVKNIGIKKTEEKETRPSEAELKRTHPSVVELKKKEESKKAEKPRQKKTQAIVRGISLPISSKQSFAISKFIKYKEIGQAIRELEEILLHKKALPMKGEIPHRRGKGVMSGRYPKNAITSFIKLLKNLNANANVNEISNPVIFEAYGNFASRPYGRFGRVRKKRTNVTIIAREKISKKEGKNTL